MGLGTPVPTGRKVCMRLFQPIRKPPSWCLQGAALPGVFIAMLCSCEGSYILCGARVWRCPAQQGVSVCTFTSPAYLMLLSSASPEAEWLVNKGPVPLTVQKVNVQHQPVQPQSMTEGIIWQNQEQPEVPWRGHTWHSHLGQLEQLLQELHVEILPEDTGHRKTRMRRHCSQRLLQTSHPG